MPDQPTEERRGAVALQRGETTLEDVLDAVPNPVSLWDTDVRNVYANRAAYALWFGRTPEQLRGMHSRDLLGPELYALNEPHQRKCLAGEAQVFERDIPGPDGTLRHAQIEYHPYWQDGAVVGLITVITDITARVRAEQAAAASTAQLAAMTERRRIEDRAHAVSLQALFAAQLQLHGIRAKIVDHASLLPAVDSTIEYIDQAITDLRATTSAATENGS